MSTSNPLKRNCFDYILEIIGITGLISSFISLLFCYGLDKDIQIPVHYNFYGEIDGWGNVSFIYTITIMSFALYIAFSVCERFYRKFNYPIKVTENNSNYLYRAAIRLMRSMKAIISVMFAYINGISVAYAYGYIFPYNTIIIYLFIIILLITVIIYFVQTLKYKE